MEKGQLTQNPGDASLAESLRTIASHIKMLYSSGSNNPFHESDYSFETLWRDLDALVQNHSIDALGGKAYGIALYGRVSSMVLDKYKEFANVGISEDEMLALLADIQQSLETERNGLTDSEKNRGFGNLIDNALRNTNSAQKQISALKGGA